MPVNVLFVLGGPPFDVDVGAAGFWINSMHEVGPAAFVQDVPQFVPGAHNVTLPLVMETVAYELAAAPSPFVRKKVTPAASDVTVAWLLDRQKPAQASPPAIQ